MADQPMVVVRGEAVREVPPDLAVLTVTVSARDPDRQAVLTRLTERAAELRRVLDEHPDGIERRETSDIHVAPDLKRRSEKVAAYTGSVSTTVTVTDFDLLGELVLRLASMDQASVSGPWWQLRPGTRAGAEVRMAAVADAMARAREYAQAVGAHVSRLVEIADEGTVPGGGVQPLAAQALRYAEADGALDVDPQLQTVHAAVIVRVAISTPPASAFR